jgi:zinc transport system substrate-binding protein
MNAIMMGRAASTPAGTRFLLYSNTIHAAGTWFLRDVQLRNHALLTMIVVCGESTSVRRRLLTGGLALAVALGVAGCASNSGHGDAPVRVVAAFYPLQYVAQMVGGGTVSVTNLVQPGAEPHDLELTPQQVAGIANADLVLYIPGFQPSVDAAVRQEAKDSALDVTTTVPMLDPTEGGGHDPHIWLDPTRLLLVTNAVASRLAAIDPTNATGYDQRAAALDKSLSTLDAEFSAGLRTCHRREIVTSHAAFGYLAERYGLDQIPIAGLSPDNEPTPRHLAEAADAARAANASTIFFETLVSPKVAEAVATAVGAKTAVLDPIEGLPPQSTSDYSTVMRANLDALRTALGCA